MPTSNHAVGMLGGELVQAHGDQHGAGDADDVRALIGDGGDLVGEDRRPGLCPGRAGGFTGFGVDDPHRVELVRFMGPGGSVAVALFGHGMDDHRPGIVPGRGQGVLHGLEVVAVHRADVLHAEVLEHPLRRPPVLDALFHGMQALVGELAHRAAVLQLPLPPVQRPLVGRGGAERVDGGTQRGEVVSEAAHGGRIGAAVVVDDDDHAAALVRRDVVDGFPGHAAGQGAVTNDRDDVAVAFSGELPGAGNAVRPGQGRGRVRAFHDVVLGLGAGRVAGHAALLAQGAEVLAAGEELVHIGLVARVEHDAVPGRIEDAVHGKRQFHHAEVGAQVSTRLGNIGYEEAPDLISQFFELPLGQPIQVLRIPDGVQDSQMTPPSGGRRAC